MPETAPTTVAEPPELSDEARLAAAQAALEDQGARDLIAWDVLEATVDAELVTFRLCGWTGVDAFDAVYRSNWAVAATADGTVEAREVGTSVDAGECLNTELIDSAFDFLAEYETYWFEMLRYPDRFGDGARAAELMTAERAADAEVFLRRRAEAGTYLDFVGEGSRPDGVAVTDVVFRRASAPGERSLQLAYCREMDPMYGVYRDGVLVDNRQDGIPEIGPHLAVAYLLVRSESGDRWLYEALDSLTWADCLAVAGNFVDGANAWLPEATAFEAVS
jgi:hypothetical protein